jgi:hypothetical protein
VCGTCCGGGDGTGIGCGWFEVTCVLDGGGNDVVYGMVDI